MIENATIRRIKDLVVSGDLSFIVGAGFSKNMSPAFADWKSLLMPIAGEMYGSELAEDKIKELGYLGIASEYVKRKGYHEAIDIEIEKKTPIIKCNNNLYEVWLGGTKVDEANPTCHQLLNNLGLKHIYTFNYDNCLDIILGTDFNKKNQNKIDELNREKDILQSLYDKYKESFMGLVDSLAEESGAYSEKNDSIASDYANLVRELKEETSSLKELSEDVTQNDRNSTIFEALIYDIDVNIKNLEKLKRQHYQLIVESGSLSLTNGGGNLYKLHGSLRLNEGEYGFDGDRHMQYVITQEDYDEYPVKHEPFVDYMKISLLRGAFCIIGFSCDDPNFSSWMVWVKEVIDSNEKIRQNFKRKDSSKLFFINAGDESLNDDKILYFKNHYIENVDLFKIYPAAKEPGERICLFLSDITPEERFYKSYVSALSRISSHIVRDYSHHKQLDISDCEYDIRRVVELGRLYRIPIQDKTVCYYRNTILGSLYGKSGGNVGNLSLDEMNLAFALLHDELLLPGVFLNDEDEYNKICELGYGDNKLFGALWLKENVMLNKSLEKCFIWESMYYNILHSLFNLNFQEAKSKLQGWNTTEQIDVLRVAQLKLLFGLDVKSEFRKLQDYSKYEHEQDYGNVVLILRRYCFAFGLSEQIANQIEEDRSSEDFKTFSDILNALVLETDECEKVKPFGNKQYNWSLGENNAKLLNSLKALNIFMELGLFTSVKNTVFFSEEKWYRIFESLYEVYTYPCLFYSLQYNNRKLVERVAQKILYSDILKEKLADIVCMMFDALMQKDCPNNFRTSLTYALPVLMKGVKPSVWGKCFVDYFNKLNPLNRQNEKPEDLNYTHEVYYNLVNYGLSHVEDRKFKIDVVKQILDKRGKLGAFDNEIVINARTTLTIDDFKADGWFGNIQENLLWLCENYASPSHIFIILNLSYLIDNEALQKSLERIDVNWLLSNEVLLKGVASFISNESSMIPKLRKATISSPNLWNTGIFDGGISAASHIEVSTVISHIQSFTDEEIKYIYEKMLDALQKIEEKCVDRHLYVFWWMNVVDVIDEMCSFVIKNRKRLSEITDVDEILRRIYITQIKMSSERSSTIMDMLINGEDKEAIRMLLNIEDDKLFPKYVPEYLLIVNKIILRKSDSLNSCLIHFVYVVGRFIDKMNNAVWSSMIDSVLNSYVPYFDGTFDWDLQHAEKDVFEKLLIKLNHVHKEYGGNNMFWDEYKNRYYN